VVMIATLMRRPDVASTAAPTPALPAA
jgi:hypothetical protein